MSIFDKRAARVLITALAFAAVLGFLWIAWRTVIAFLFAIFFAYLLEGVVDFFARRFKHHGRAKGILLTYLAIFGSIAIVLAIFGGNIAQEAQKLSQQLPGLSERLSNGQLIHTFGTRRGWSAETEQRAQQFFTAHQEQIVTTVEGYVKGALASAQSMWWLLLVPILAIFFLKDGTHFRDDIIGFFPRPQHKRMIAILLSELNQMLGHFMRAQVALSALAMVVITLGLVVLKVPYSYALGPIAGALEFIPVIGPIIGGAIVLIVAFAAGSKHLILVLLFLLVWRGVQDYVTSPRIMGGRLELHPLAVLFGVLAGGEVGGVIGVFISVPVLAAIKIVWRTYNAYRVPDRISVTEPIEPTLVSTPR